MTPTPLTDETLAHGLRVLARRDRDLARVIDQYGPPPMWARRPGFPTLIHIILEQQVSLASARAAFNRLKAAIRVTPRNLLTLDDATLKTIGFSRQKTGYARHLAQAILDRRFNPAALANMDDESARAALIELKGIGVWTAEIYLLMALRRPDVWPHGDLALAVAAHHVKQLPARPTYDELTAMSEAWRPWRAVAARVLWHHYLSQRKR
ncbi:MAG: DNA-3-methyladenine glycosylase 2 family protein [Chloroflexi bacterium]|nr:DNA-3-methyladenine glycosylase 2 family protein [Chloroflexota bacterium]